MNNTVNFTVELVISRMQDEIKKHSLEVLQRYPDDLLVHDRGMLNRHAVPGAKIGWVVGDLHTHLVPLGLHKTENENVGCLLNMSRGDHFYVLSISAGGTVSFKEIDRDAFGKLEHTRVPYSREGGLSSFWLLHAGARVAHCATEVLGDVGSREYRCTITPTIGMSALDKAAISTWCMRSVIEQAHSLFAFHTENWVEAVQSMPVAKVA